MKVLTQFGYTSPKLYTFPRTEVNYRDNFGELVTFTGRMPGADGGFDELGFSRSLHEVGTVQAEFWLHYNTLSEASSKLEDLQEMANWGKQLLFMQPSDISLDTRWTWARLDNIYAPENVRDLPHKRLRVKVTFQCADPFWYGAGNQELWNGSRDFNGAIDWDGTGLTTITGSGTLTVAPGGNQYTHARFVAQVTGAQTFNELLIRRVVSNRVVDQMIYQGTLVQDDVIEIDPRRNWVIVNGEDKISRFNYTFPDWMRLEPGSNSLTVSLDESTAEISAAVRYYERYT